MAGRFQRSLSFGPGDYEGYGPGRRGSRRNTSVIASTLWSILTSSRYSHTAQSSVVTSPTPGINEPDGAFSPSAESEERKQAEAWSQATYNAVALVLVFVTGCIVMAVYYILEPFLYPLLWAVLIGIVLHPVKQASTSGIRKWLCYLDKSSIPLSVGITLCPIFLLNWLTVQFEYIVYSNWKMLLSSCLGIVSLLLMYYLNLPVHFIRLMHFISSFLHSLELMISYASFLQFCTVSVGFVVLLILSKQSEYHTALRVLSTSLWLLTLVNVAAYLFGSIAAPLVAILFLSAAVITFASKDRFLIPRRRKKPLSKGGSVSSPLQSVKTDPKMVPSRDEDDLEKGVTLRTAASLVESENPADDTTIDIEKAPSPHSDNLKDSQTNLQDVQHTDRQSIITDDLTLLDDTENLTTTTLESLTVTDSADSEVINSATEEGKVFKTGSKECGHKHTVSFKSDSMLVSHEDDEVDDTELTVHDLATNTPRVSTHSSRGVDEVDTRTNFLAPADSRKARGQSNQVFLILSSTCLIVLLWKYPLFLLLLLPLCVLCGLKYLFSLAVVKDSSICKLPEVTIAVMSWVRQRKQVLFPSPMPMLVRMYLFVDRKVLNFVKHSTGSLLSAFIIISLIFVSVSGVILLFIEIQVELSHYIGVAVEVWNRTIAENPNLKEWIGDGNESIHSTFGLFADQSYVHGREWLATKLHSLASGSGANTSIVEKRILNLFDQLYQSYVLKNTSSTSLITGYRDNVTVDYEHNEKLWYELQRLVSDNLETIISVLQSLWSIFSENLALAVSFLYVLLELLFTGGTALLNVVVFITALFYLLSYSEEDYLPVKWVTDLLPHLTQQQQLPTTSGGGGGGGGEDLGRAFSRAIRSVFHASLRRALFYGLYTWLIHTVFGLPVSILPSVLAAVTGAMPFVGSYWLAMPAVLELWLMSGSPLAALALLGLSLMPYFFVETLINREIEGGHPYLTGLAIAGGIYFAGLEGALFGPILLCCLLFFVDFYGGIFN